MPSPLQLVTATGPVNHHHLEVLRSSSQNSLCSSSLISANSLQTMDSSSRPAGPRAPTDRNEVYASIFGRPSATHHQPTPPPPQFYQPPYTHHQQYQAHVDRRMSYNPAMQAYPQQVQHHPHPVPPPPLPHGAQAAFPPRAQSLAPPSVQGPRTPSAISSHRSSALLDHPAVDPPDSAQLELQRQGLTPAQAYQVQVGRSLPAPINGLSGAPRVGIGLPVLDSDDGRLGIDFGTSSSPSDEDSSELPYSRGGNDSARRFFNHSCKTQGAYIYQRIISPLWVPHPRSQARCRQCKHLTRPIHALTLFSLKQPSNPVAIP